MTVIVVTLAVDFGCDKSGGSPVVDVLSQSADAMMIGVQDNALNAKAAVLIKTNRNVQCVSLPARRFVPFRMAIAFHDFAIIARLDGEIFVVNGIDDTPRVTRTEI